MSDLKPMILSRWASLFWHEGVWETNGPQSAYAYHPLRVTGESDARPSWFGDRVTFYDRTGNKRLGDESVHSLSGAGDDLIFLGDRHAGAWYQVTSAQVVYESDRGGWFVRWLCYKNTRTARAMNAMMIAFLADSGVHPPTVDHMATIVREAIAR